MSLELKSPAYEREVIHVAHEISNLSVPFNGSVASAKSEDEYQVKNNIIDLLGSEPGSKTIAQYSNHFKLTAAIYEDLWRRRSLTLLTGESFPVEKEQELLIEWTTPRAGGYYLDVGASTALYARALKTAEPKAEVVAMDFSKQMLQEARLKSEAEQANIYLLRADATQMPFFSKSFDGLVMGGTLNELPDPDRVLHEMRRILEDHGVVFMMHLIKSDSWVGQLLQGSASLGGLQFWTVDESNEMFKNAGFRVDEQITRGIVCFSRLLPV